jgi:hypothetical protein
MVASFTPALAQDAAAHPGQLGNQFNYLVDSYGADCSGAKDSTAAINDAISAAEAADGGRVLFNGPCNYSVSGTVTVTKSRVTLEGLGSIGVSYVNCTGGSADCIFIGGQSSQVYDTTIRNLYITSSRSGGACIDLNGAANTYLQNFVLGPCYNGIYNQWTNNTVLEHFIIQGLNGQYGIKWYGLANDRNRSDVFVLNDGTINPLYHPGTDCIVWDGPTYTMRVNELGVLDCRIGLHVQNTQHSKKDFPQFLFANDIEFDGMSQSAVVIDAGADLHFSNSDMSNTSGSKGQGSADTDCVVINPDKGYGYTRNIFFTGNRIGNCRNRAMYLDARDIYLTGNNVHSASKAGLNLYPQAEIGPDAVDVSITGGKFSYEFGDPVNADYGIVIDAPLQNQNISISGVSFVGNNKGGVLNNSGRPISLHGGFDDNSVPIN